MVKEKEWQTNCLSLEAEITKSMRAFKQTPNRSSRMSMIIRESNWTFALGAFMVISLVVRATLLATGSAEAAVWKSDDSNFSIALPSSKCWTHISLPVDSVKVALRDDGGARTVTVYIFDITWDLERQIDVMRKRWFIDGVSSGRSEESFRLNGRLAHRFSDIVNTGGIKLWRVATIIVDQGKLYQVTASSGGGHPREDPELSTMLASMMFISPLRQPERSESASVDATDTMRDRIVDITVFAVAGIGLIAIVWMGKRSGAKRPPPLPV